MFIIQFVFFFIAITSLFSLKIGLSLSKKAHKALKKEIEAHIN
jgi:hypothetical protein